MTRLALALALGLATGAACKQQKDQPTPQPGSAAPQMSAAETQRNQDACKVYVERVCGCAGTIADGTKQCELARALPEAIRIGLEVAATPDSKPDIVRQSLDGVRKTAKECIEQTAKLTALGCR